MDVRIALAIAVSIVFGFGIIAVMLALLIDRIDSLIDELSVIRRGVFGLYDKGGRS